MDTLAYLYVHAYTARGNSINVVGFADFVTWKPPVFPVADLIVRNGVIYTSDESLLFADSMAVGNGRILRVGNYSFVQVPCV